MIWMDGASFVKTGENGKIWTMVMSILDLEPNLRCKIENLIPVFHLGFKIKINQLLL